MTTGAVIFAQNNSAIDYVKMADYAAFRAKTFLDIPVSLVTDNKNWLIKNIPQHHFDKIIEIPKISHGQTKKFSDGALSYQVASWNNFSRTSVYDLTPYDTTLVIDSDYMINSTNLKQSLSLDHDFQIYKQHLDLAYNRDSSTFVRISKYSIPFYWATTFIFKKNQLTKRFFDLIGYIRANWPYYRTLYSIDAPAFRNDFAFSIAIHLMEGNCVGDFVKELPGKMVYLTDSDILVDIKGNKLRFLTEKRNYKGEYIAGSTGGLDVHVMNKISLLRFISGGQGV